MDVQRSPYSVSDVMDSCQQCAFSGTLIMWLAFLGNTLDSRSRHLLLAAQLASSL